MNKTNKRCVCKKCEDFRWSVSPADLFVLEPEFMIEHAVNPVVSETDDELLKDARDLYRRGQKITKEQEELLYEAGDLP